MGSTAPETAALNAGTITTGTLVGSSLVSVMGDSSDATYVQGVFTDLGSGSTEEALVLDGVGFADLIGGVDITSFVVNVRASAVVSNGISASSFTGIAGVAPSFAQSLSLTASPTNYTIGPFTKSGGGKWTPAQVNALLCKILFVLDGTGSFTMRLYELSLTVTP